MSTLNKSQIVAVNSSSVTHFFNDFHLKLIPKIHQLLVVAEVNFFFFFFLVIIIFLFDSFKLNLLFLWLGIKWVINFGFKHLWNHYWINITIKFINDLTHTVQQGNLSKLLLFSCLILFL